MCLCHLSWHSTYSCVILFHYFTLYVVEIEYGVNVAWFCNLVLTALITFFNKYNMSQAMSSQQVSCKGMSSFYTCKSYTLFPLVRCWNWLWLLLFYNSAIQICSDHNLFDAWLMNLNFFVCVDAVVVRK